MISTLSSPDWSATSVVAATRSLTGRSSSPGEHKNIDQSVTALVRLHDRCAFDDDAKRRCDNCGHSFNQSSHLRDLCLRDQAVRGLSDAGMQRRVLMEEYDQQLTLHRTLQICQAYKASRVTEQALNQDDPPQLLAARYFALFFSFLLSWLVTLEQCWSTPPLLVSCELVLFGKKGC